VVGIVTCTLLCMMKVSASLFKWVGILIAVMSMLLLAWVLDIVGDLFSI